MAIKFNSKRESSFSFRYICPVLKCKTCAVLCPLNSFPIFSRALLSFYGDTPNKNFLQRLPRMFHTSNPSDDLVGLSFREIFRSVTYV